MISSAKRGNVISKWKTPTEILKRELRDGKIIGHTLSVGSRSSKIYLRIYDKAMEQRVAGPWTE